MPVHRQQRSNDVQNRASRTDRFSRSAKVLRNQFMLIRQFWLSRLNQFNGNYIDSQMASSSLCH